MPECPYCDQDFEGESAIRRHLHEDHDPEELGRIDSRRVEEYVREHGLDEDGRPEMTSGDPSFRTAMKAIEGELSAFDPDRRIPPAELRERSTDEIVEGLRDLGVYPARNRFRDRAKETGSASGVWRSWVTDYHVAAKGYDADFVWMSAVVLWGRWADDIPKSDLIADLAMQAATREDRRDHVGAFERTCRLFREFLVVVADETTLKEAIEAWDGPIDMHDSVYYIVMPPPAVPSGDPRVCDDRLLTCRAMISAFPAMDWELRRQAHHGIVESLFARGQVDAADAVYEGLVQSFPRHAVLYREWGDLHREGIPSADVPTDSEWANAIYERGLDADAEPVGLLLEVYDRPQDADERRDP